MITKSSAYPDYNVDNVDNVDHGENVDGDEKEPETIEVFRAIARHVWARQ